MEVGREVHEAKTNSSIEKCFLFCVVMSSLARDEACGLGTRLFQY